MNHHRQTESCSGVIVKLNHYQLLLTKQRLKREAHKEEKQKLHFDVPDRVRVRAVIYNKSNRSQELGIQGFMAGRVTQAKQTVV